jgi:hypothetical protein
MIKHLLCATSALALANITAGQIASVGPFAGPHTEGFETQPALANTPYACLPGRIFAGTADLCDPLTQSVILPSFWSLFCQATPHQGARYALGLESPVVITFDSPVRRLGGYFGTVGGVDGAVVDFQDAAGVPLGTATLITNDCSYTWNGWESATPFTRVRIVGNTPFSDGGYIHMDDLEYSAGANPCYANCDASTTQPILNVGDFTCFLQRFAAADPYANCDQSTVAPVLNVGDFTCFLQRFAAGCR